MHSRRKFIVKSGLTTAALVALNPLETLASVSSPFSSHRQVTLLHTSMENLQVVSNLKRLGQKNINPLLLHAGKETTVDPSNFDAASGALPENFEGSYKIMQKGNVRIGIMEAHADNMSTPASLDQLAEFLKEDKKCDLVICLSQLGFSNRKHIDDIRIAEKSSFIDVVLGNKQPNSPAQPFVARNKNRAEVLIHYSGDKDAIGNIQIMFDENGKRRSLAIDYHFHPANTKA